MAEETSNRVLRSLASKTRSTVMAECKRVELEGRTMLARMGNPTHFVFFPETAVISALATYRDGSNIEMANIGCEACTGIGLVLGNPNQMITEEVQIAGSALVMASDSFASLKSSLPDFEHVMLSAVQAVIHQVMVSGACNGAHGAKQRLARWLLTMSDRIAGETMNLTQEFLSEMLAVRRATVSDVASELQNAGLIGYERGRIRITDRPGLEAASCECYGLVRDAYDLLLPESDNTA